MKLINLILARKVIGEHMADKLPSALAYKLMKFMKASDNEDAFYNERMGDIINKYGERNEDGEIKVKDNRVSLKEGCIEKCNQSISELQNTEIDRPNFAFSIEELEPFKLSIAEISSLDEFINES